MKEFLAHLAWQAARGLAEELVFRLRAREALAAQALAETMAREVAAGNARKASGG
jgi:hypothetical protein